MALFENFPYTNLHELNLDWLIQEMENLKELVQDGPVISVNGQTGVVTLYQEAQVRLPDVTDAQQTYWNIFRSLNGHLYGIRFDSNGNVYAIRDGIRTKLLTWADIPPEAGVISVNGLYGVVHISGTDIPWMGGENETIFDKLSENEDAIDLLNITLGTLTNAIKAGIAYLEPNVDDTAIHNIPAGRYVFWKNYAYKSTQAISIGDTLSSTNLQVVGDGGFVNDLQTQLNTLNNNISPVNLGSKTTLAALEAALIELNSSLTYGLPKRFTVNPSEYGVFAGTFYTGEIVKDSQTATDRFSVIMYRSNLNEVVKGAYYDSAFHWDTLALNSSFSKKEISATPGNGVDNVDGYYIKTGNLVTINYRITIGSNDIPAGNHLIVNMTNQIMNIGSLAVNGICGLAHKNSTSEQVGVYMETYAPPYGLCLDSGGTFLANTSYRGSITFITT